VETNGKLGLRGFNGSLLARLGWAQLQDGDTRGAEIAYSRALDLARRLSNSQVVFLALAGRAVLHRLDGCDRVAADEAVEALELYLAGEPRRLANRIDPRSDLLAGAAVCCTELGILAVRAGETEQAVRLFGHAERLRTDAAVPVPKFQRDALQRALETASALLEPGAFHAAFDLGQQGQLGDSVPFKP
jgi:tetratricopeptide (TPR) repeat protein